MQTEHSTGLDFAPLSTHGFVPVRVAIRVWGKASRKLKSTFAADALGADHAIVKEMARVIGKEALSPLTTIESRARALLNFYSAPTPLDGARFIHREKLADVLAALRMLEDEFDTAVDQFVANYPAARDAILAQQGTAADPEAYPPASKVREGCDFSLTVLPFGATDVTEILSAQEVQRLNNELYRACENAKREAVAALAVRFHEAVTASVESLSGALDGTKKCFRDSAIENLRELVDVLPSINLTGDPLLEQARLKLSKVLDGVDPELLRGDKTIAAQVTASLADLAASVEGLMEAAPVRKLKIRAVPVAAPESESVEHVAA